jgi:hypothetical protein
MGNGVGGHESKRIIRGVEGEKGRGRRNRRRIEGVNKIKVCFMYKSYCVQLIDVKENIMAIKSSYTLKTCYQGGVRIGKKNKNMLSILSTYSL